MAQRLDPGFVDELVAAVPARHESVMAVNSLSGVLSAMARTPFTEPSAQKLQESGSHPASVARSRLKLFSRLAILRTSTLLDEAIRSISDLRLLAFAMAVRGTLETAAVVAHHGDGLLLPASTKTLPVEYDALLRSAVMSGKFDWPKYLGRDGGKQSQIDGYDSDPKDQVPQDRALNVSTMVEHFGTRMRKSTPKAKGIVLLDYAMLSDICHPSAGGHLAFLVESEPELRVELAPSRQVATAVAGMFLPTLAYSASSIVEGLVELRATEELLARFAGRGNAPG